MNNYYLRYEKKQNAKYVSHLDFVRMFGRAMRRAHLPIAFSEGFNPHPLLTFALPLPVGYTSRCELMEFTLTDFVEPDTITAALNSVLPLGVTITKTFVGKSRMKELDNALYTVYPQRLPGSVSEFLSLKSIPIDKKTKSGIKEADIRGDIKIITLHNDCIKMVLSSGSRANLKPEVVMNAMNKYIPLYISGECEYHREKIYTNDMTEI